MGKHILFAVLSGLLAMGMSTAFAEEPQLSDQEILKAWGQGQTEVQQLSEAGTLEGKQLLTDEGLDEVNAAGFPVITNQASHFAFLQPGIVIGGVKTRYTGACANSQSCGGNTYYGVIVDKSVQGGLVSNW